MDQKLMGKVVVITGASKGIGADIVRGMVQTGASVVVHYNSDRIGAKAVVC